MKKMLFFIIFFTIKNIVLSQITADCHKEGGMFISEIGNYGHGEYIELTVYGSSSNPTAPVNLEGWIIDDNNTALPDVGNESGHIRLGQAFSAVKPGTLIVLASKKDKPQEVRRFPAYEYNDNVIITFGTGLIGIENCPNTASSQTNYNCQDFSIGSFTDFKNYAALDNQHDALQVRNREGQLIHALYWTPAYEEAANPKAVDISSFLEKNNIKGSLNLSHIKFINDKNWYDKNSFEIFPSLNGVTLLGNPGEPNNANHANLIDKMKQGIYSSALKASVNVVQQPTSKNNDGVVEVKIEGGTSDYSVLIQGVNNNFYLQKDYNRIGAYEMENIPSGAIKVFIVDAEECGLIFDLVLEESKALCSGECKEIGVEPNQYCKYEWNPSKDILDTKNSKVKVCPSETTTYILKVVDNNGNIKELKYNVVVKTADVSLKTALICSGQSKTLSVKGKDPLWSTGEKTNEIAVSNPGVYSVSVTDEAGCKVNAKIVVLSGTNPDNIKRYFRALGFYENEVDIRAQPPAVAGNNIGAKPIGGGTCLVSDLTKNTSLFLEDTEVKLRQEYEHLCAKKLTTAEQFYITENQNVCENFAAFEQVEKDFLSGKKTYWVHKFLNGNQKCLFVKINYKGDFFFNSKKYEITSNQGSKHNFYLFTDRGEYLGEYSIFQTGIPGGIYFVDHESYSKGDKGNVIKMHRWLHPFSKFSERVVFDINENTAKVMENKFILGKGLKREIGGILWDNNSEVNLEQCNSCSANLTTLQKEEVFDKDRYTHNSNPFIGWWHTHPDAQGGFEPSGASQGPACSPCQCDIAGINDKATLQIGQEIKSLDRWLLYKLAGGIGMIFSRDGITIFRSGGYSIFETDIPNGDAILINGSYFRNKNKNDSICTYDVDYFPKGQVYAIIPFDLDKIKLILLKK